VKKQVEIRQFKDELTNKYLRSDPEYQKMTQEGQHYWDLIILAYLDFFRSNNYTRTLLIKDVDSKLYPKLKINSKETSEHASLEMLNALMQFFKVKQDVNSVNLEHLLKLIFLKTKIEENKRG